jgi:cytochrome c551/c552
MNNYNNYFSKIVLLKWVALFLLSSGALSQESPKEEDYFKIAKVSAPEGVILEVGGLTVLLNGDLGISTRRGDIYIVENPTSRRPYFRKFASGLHEVLGLVYKEGALYCAQRGELTKLVDRNKDGKADLYQTVFSWPISGHYHEYSFGPKLAPDGSFFVSANVAFGDEQWWRGESRVPWRGWMMHIYEDGRMEPWATGLRSPCGLGIIDDELFYDDNQGDWIGSGGIVHLKKGAFAGHPAGLRWAGMPNSPVKLSTEQLYAVVGPRENKNDLGRYIKPENVVNEKFVTLFEAKQKLPQIQLPAVWLPHGVLGISNSEIVKIPEGVFGPFSGQLLVGDQGQSKISRVFMEKVAGEYQGAAWEFRSGFQSGVLRLAWANDGSLFVGETNRGWGSVGEASQGLQRLIWNNATPFEMRSIKAMPDGFEIEFTRPADKKSAEDIASYSVESFIYKYHPVYGSPTVNTKKHGIKGVKVSADGMTARILVDNPRRYYIHTISLDGVRSKDGFYSLVHPTGYYTLNNIPEGKKLLMSEVSTKNSGKLKTKKTAAKGDANSGTPDDPANRKNVSATTAREGSMAQVNRLLVKNTCTACHNAEKKQVGPAFKDIARRNYSVSKIVSLIYNPKPQNWPGYATEMPPMPQVPKEDAQKIATWIRSLR